MKVPYRVATRRSINQTPIPIAVQSRTIDWRQTANCRRWFAAASHWRAPLQAQNRAGCVVFGLSGPILPHSQPPRRRGGWLRRSAEGIRACHRVTHSRIRGRANIRVYCNTICARLQAERRGRPPRWPRTWHRASRHDNNHNEPVPALLHPDNKKHNPMGGTASV